MAGGPRDGGGGQQVSQEAAANPVQPGSETTNGADGVECPVASAIVPDSNVWPSRRCSGGAVIALASSNRVPSEALTPA